MRSENQECKIDWIEEFVRKIKPFIYVRLEDSLLILIPNQVYRLNRSGLEILNFLLRGRKIKELISLLCLNEKQIEEIHYFFSDLRAIIKGCLHEGEKRKAVDYYEFKGSFNKLPVLSEVAVTYRCNLSCQFCYVGKKGDWGELSTEDLKIILRKIFFEAKVPSVSFTGGEPLLRNDILKLIKYAHCIGLWTNLITNGTLIDRTLAHKLKKSGLSSSQVSIEGPDSEIHDRLTGVTGSFTKTVTGVKYLIDAGIPVHTNTTVSRDNIESLERIVRLAKNLGLARLSMNLLIPCGSAVHRKDLWLSYTEIGDYILNVKHLADTIGVKFLWYSPVPICKFNPISHGLGNKSCAAVSGLLSIDPVGNVLPCSSWTMPIGSLLNENFDKVWNSVEAGYFKKLQYAPETCQDCESFHACVGACPIYWENCGTKELKEMVINAGV